MLGQRFYLQACTNSASQLRREERRGQGLRQGRPLWEILLHHAALCPLAGVAGPLEGPALGSGAGLLPTRSTSNELVDRATAGVQSDLTESMTERYHVSDNVCKHCPPGHAPAQGQLPQDPREHRGTRTRGHGDTQEPLLLLTFPPVAVS